MPSTPGYYTVRLPSLPPSRVTDTSLHSLFPLEDAGRITRSSLARGPLGNITSNVATVTFDGIPGFVDGKTRLGQLVDFDTDFYGLTPLNSTEGNSIQAEYVHLALLQFRFESRTPLKLSLKL